jgi:hypothetical protein
MFTILDPNSVDSEVLEELVNLNNRNRLIKKFVLLEAKECNKTKSGASAYRIGIYLPDEDRKIWGGGRQLIESVLIYAGVCAPDFTTQQELKWRELKQILNQFFNPLEIQSVIFQDCRNATLHGWVDSLEKKLPLTTYLRCKKIISELGDDNFAKDYKWYFGKSLPEDSYKGLEED